MVTLPVLCASSAAAAAAAPVALTGSKQHVYTSHPACPIAAFADLVCGLYPYRLAFDMPASSYWDYFNQSLRYASGGSRTVWPYGRSNTVGYPTPPATDFVQWVKRQIIAGRPLMVAVRLPKAVLNDAVYDHIIPFWGVCSGDVGVTAALNSATDGFSLSTDFGVSCARHFQQQQQQQH